MQKVWLRLWCPVGQTVLLSARDGRSYRAVPQTAFLDVTVKVPQTALCEVVVRVPQTALLEVVVKVPHTAFAYAPVEDASVRPMAASVSKIVRFMFLIPFTLNLGNAFHLVPS